MLRPAQKRPVSPTYLDPLSICDSNQSNGDPSIHQAHDRPWEFRITGAVQEGTFEYAPSYYLRNIASILQDAPI